MIRLMKRENGFETFLKLCCTPCFDKVTTLDKVITFTRQEHHIH
jgi:alkyl hydroperoxide reductase subunit AhpF